MNFISDFCISFVGIVIKGLLIWFFLNIVLNPTFAVVIV